MHCQKRRLTYAVLLLVVGVALGSACVVAHGPLPGDVGVTKLLQSTFGTEPFWADPITQSAKHPWVWLTLAIGIGLSCLRSSWRGPVVIGCAFAAVKLLDLIMRASLYAPKPISDLVAVASPSDSSGFPSTFGLVFAAIFGGVLLTAGKPGKLSTVIAIIAGFMVVIGAASRIVLGGHWTSQILASVCLALTPVLMVDWLLEWRRERRSQIPNL